MIECEEYKEERKELEKGIIKEIGKESWEREKQEEDKGIKTILGLKENVNVTTTTKKYLKEIWKKRNTKKTTTEIVTVREHSYFKNKENIQEKE